MTRRKRADDYRTIPPLAAYIDRINVQVVALMFDNEFPLAFDLADRLPSKFWKDDRYVGRQLSEYFRPATWATKSVRSGKKEYFAARPTFASEAASIVPTLLSLPFTAESPVTARYAGNESA